MSHFYDLDTVPGMVGRLKSVRMDSTCHGATRIPVRSQVKSVQRLGPVLIFAVTFVFKTYSDFYIVRGFFVLFCFWGVFLFFVLFLSIFAFQTETCPQSTCCVCRATCWEPVSHMGLGSQVLQKPDLQYRLGSALPGQQPQSLPNMTFKTVKLSFGEK